MIAANATRAPIFVAGYDPTRAQAAMRRIREHGESVSLDWTSEPFDTPYKERPAWTEPKARSMLAAIRSSVALVLLWEPGTMESARWEAGIALGQRLPVFVAGDVDLFYGYTPT